MDANRSSTPIRSSTPGNQHSSESAAHPPQSPRRSGLLSSEKNTEANSRWRNHFGRVAQLFPLWFLRQTHRQRVSLDKNEGVVKVHESCAEGTVNEPVWLRTRTLEHSLGITSGWKPVPPTVDSAPTAAMILLCEHPATAGCESAQSIPTVWLATGGPAFSHFGFCMNLPDKGCPVLARCSRGR